MQNSNTYKFKPSNGMLTLFVILLLLKSISVSAQVGDVTFAMNETTVNTEQVDKSEIVKNISEEKIELTKEKEVKKVSVDKKPYVRRKRWVRYDGYKMND